MLRSVEKKVLVRVSAQVSNRGQNIGVARFWASRGNIASQVRGALSSHCSEGGTEGADSRLLVLPYSHRPQGAQKAALLLDQLVLLAFVVRKSNPELEQRHSSVLGSNRLILS